MRMFKFLFGQQLAVVPWRRPKCKLDSGKCDRQVVAQVDQFAFYLQLLLCKGPVAVQLLLNWLFQCCKWRERERERERELQGTSVLAEAALVSVVSFRVWFLFSHMVLVSVLMLMCSNTKRPRGWEVLSLALSHCALSFFPLSLGEKCSWFCPNLSLTYQSYF